MLEKGSYFMGNETYTLWIKSQCPFCVEAQQELLRRKKTHTVVVMDEKPEELNEVKKLWDHATVPIVVMQEGDVEVFICGYTDLMDWFENSNDVESSHA